MIGQSHGYPVDQRCERALRMAERSYTAKKKNRFQPKTPESVSDLPDIPGYKRPPHAETS